MHELHSDDGAFDVPMPSDGEYDAMADTTADYIDYGIYPEEELLPDDANYGASADDFFEDREPPPETNNKPYFIVPDGFFAPNRAAAAPSITELFENEILVHQPTSLEHLYVLPSSEDTVNEHVIVRRFPARHHDVPPMTPQEAEQRITDTITHFKVLAGTIEQPGIAIPNTYYEVKKVADGTGNTVAHIMSITERVDAVRFDIADWHGWQGGITNPAELEAAIKLVRSLTSYYAWVLDTGQPTFLADISEVTQYRYDPDSRQPILLDTDSYTLSVDSRKGRGYFSTSLSNLISLTNAMPPTMRERGRLQGPVTKLFRKLVGGKITRL